MPPVSPVIHAQTYESSVRFKKRSTFVFFSSGLIRATSLAVSTFTRQPLGELTQGGASAEVASSRMMKSMRPRRLYPLTRSHPRDGRRCSRLGSSSCTRIGVPSWSMREWTRSSCSALQSRVFDAIRCG